MTTNKINSLSSVNPDSTHTPIGAIEKLKLARAQASADLDKLLRLKTEQKKKYGCLLQTKPNHYCRHLLVQAFFSMQACKLEKPKLFQGKFRCDLAIIVAHSHNARGGTAQQIVRWECSWVENRVILETQARKNKLTFSWMEDEELITDVCTYIKAQGDSKNNL